MGHRMDRPPRKPAGVPASSVQFLPLRDRRSHCWNITRCGGVLRDNCFAYFKRTNCWEIWAGKSGAQKGCCMKLEDCKQCPVFLANMRPAITLKVDFGLSTEELATAALEARRRVSSRAGQTPARSGCLPARSRP